MAANLLSVALDAGIAVPEQLAIVGADNVERYCMFGKVQLSSIDLDTSRIAFRGAQLLDHLMAGGAPPATPILVPPRGLIARRSTDQLAYEDPTVASAMRCIRQRAAEKLTVEALLREVNVSRSWLERKFQLDVGRSPGQEIRRQRLERARELLRSTSMPLAAIADACGFDYLSHFSTAFRRHYGQTPSQYRALAREG
jgi:LacI family transcriptional regulator